MDEEDFSNLSIKEMHRLMQAGDLSARQILVQCLDKIAKQEKDLHAFLEVFDDAEKQAKKVDEKIKAGQSLSVLAGIPLAIKDNILMAGKKCSAGSKILEDYRATYDATVIKKLKENDAVFVGRANMDEFAMGASTEFSAFGMSKNPFDKTRVPGGSSGGSAVAVAYGGAQAALGSDTGGSVRLPAAFCGLVGLKPTYGAISRYGLMAMASSLDQIGPLAKNVEDVEIIFEAIKGRDKNDPTSVSLTNNDKQQGKDDQKLKIGIPEEFFSFGGKNNSLSFGVEKSMRDTIDLFESNGHKVVSLSLPHVKYAVESYYILVCAEVSSNMARYDGIKYGLSRKGESLAEDYQKTRSAGFGPEVQRRILLGTYILSAGHYDNYYARAQKTREAIKDDFRKAFGGADVILSPTSIAPAFKIGEKVSNPVTMYLNDVFTNVANLSGLPAISVPCGFEDPGNGKKLPLGVQFLAPWFREDLLFSVSKFFEKNFK